MNREEAIKILKYRHDISLPFEREALETLIPEFKESEDERIRKELVVEFQCWEGIPETKRRQYLAYLEKQKEQKPADEQFPPLEGLDAIKAKYYDDGFKNGFDEGVASVKPTWSVEDESMHTRIMGILGKCLIGELPKECKEELNWLRDLPIRLNLQPKQEWNEEKERAYQKEISYFPKITKNIPQSHWEPSEEELVALKRVGGILRDYGHSELAKMVFMIEGKLANLAVLNKSIWKSSKEQLEALRIAMDRNDSVGYNLNQLYEQLKKLM